MKNTKILLIEDNPGDARLIKEMLGEGDEGGFELEWADRFSKGLEQIAKGGIDLILLDLSLPDSQGLDTFIKMNAHAETLPIVVLSGLDDRQIRHKAIQQGAQDYLVKGQIDRNVLVRAIRYAIERKGFHEGMRKSEERFRTIVSHNSDGMVLVSKNGTILFVNPAAESLFGYNSEELIGETFGYPIITEKLSDIDIVKKGGKGAVAEMSSVEISWEGDTACLLSLRDVTEVSKARKRVESLAKLIENAKYVMIFILRCDGRIVECNALASMTFGYSKKEMCTRGIIDLCKFDPKKTWEKIAGIIHQESSWRGEMVGVCKDESEFPLDMVLSKADSEKAENAGIIGFARDVTKEKEIDRMKSEFISVASHEMRTPLTSIKSAIDLILKKMAGDITEPQEKFLLMAERNVMRLNNLIGDLLDISKIEAGKAEFNLAEIDLEDCIQNTQSGLRNLANEKSISLKTIIVPNLPTAYADISKIERVLINIVGNAIKFSPTGGIVTIRASRAQDKPDSTEDISGFLEISVEDNGIGIPEESVGYIFEKFYQVESSLSKLPGTGLGLAISKNLVEANGGKISCKSKKGKGTTISFTIPVFDRQQQFSSAFNKAIVEAKKQYSPLTLLIIRLFNISHDTEGADTIIHEKAVQIIKEKAIDGKIKKTDMVSIFPMSAEIAIIMPNTGRKEAQIVQKRIECQTSSTEIAVEGFKFIASHTGGIACFPEDGQSPEELQDFARKSYESTKKSCRR